MQVFDQVVTTIPPRAQAGKLRLLREAVAADPNGVYPVIDDLFNLAKADREASGGCWTAPRSPASSGPLPTSRLFTGRFPLPICMAADLPILCLLALR